jgi:DNA-binding NarL/FixJ family response regulator
MQHTPPTQPPLRTIVADDDPLARRTVKDALQGSGIVVIAEAGSGREAIELARYYKPDIVLMDLVMPDVDGLEATRRIAEIDIPTQVLVLTASNDQELGLVALRSGAAGFLSKEVDLGSLARAVEGVARGEAGRLALMTMRLVEKLRRAAMGGPGMRPVRSRLTDREWEVLDLLVREYGTGGHRRRARPLHGDRPVAHQEPPAQARRLHPADAIALAVRMRDHGEMPDELVA